MKVIKVHSRRRIMNLKKHIKEKIPKALIKSSRRVCLELKGVRYTLDMLLFPRITVWFCPCCKKRFQSFEEGNYLRLPDKIDTKRYINIRQDIICPFCGSLPRHRILASWFEDNKAIIKSSNLLYFAPEKSMMLWMDRNKVKYTTADLFHSADIKIDIQDTKLPSNSIDLIICNHVLEHVDDFRKALREIHRILRSGGSFICSFPMDPQVDLVWEDPMAQTNEERIERFGQFDHKRVFGMHADQLLTEAEFKVEKISGDSYPDEILPIVGPADYDMNILFRCVK